MKSPPPPALGTDDDPASGENAEAVEDRGRIRWLHWSADVSCEQPLGSAAACLCKHTNWRPKEPTRNIRTAEGCRNQRRLSDGTEPSAELKVT